MNNRIEIFGNLFLVDDSTIFEIEFAKKSNVEAEIEFYDSLLGIRMLLKTKNGNLISCERIQT